MDLAICNGTDTGERASDTMLTTEEAYIRIKDPELLE